MLIRPLDMSVLQQWCNEAQRICRPSDALTLCSRGSLQAGIDAGPFWTRAVKSNSVPVKDASILVHWSKLTSVKMT